MPSKKATKRRKAPAKKRVPKPQATMVVMQGDGLLGDINKFLKKHKVISRGASVASLLGVPHADKVAKGAKFLGYGKTGSGLKVPGSGLNAPGQHRTRNRRTLLKKKY